MKLIDKLILMFKKGYNVKDRVDKLKSKIKKF